MKTIHSIYLAFASCSLAFLMTGCSSQAGGDFTGREYMPDMAHSIAYEANVYGYYKQNRWGTEEEYRKAADPREPVPGTVSYKETKWDFRKAENAEFYPIYHYANTEEERTRATAEILSNPLRPKGEAEFKAVLTKGKELYTVYCGSCHGDKGDGNGQLYNNGTGPYPLKPASYLTEEFLAASDGRYYHAIMHGKNAMLAHADKLSFEERWMVIHYIRDLQGKETKEPYTLSQALGKKAAPALAEELEDDAKKKKSQEEADTK